MSIRVSRIGRIAIAVVLAASPLRAMQQDASEARVVITLDSLDRATFANVAELLQARVPGLTITRDGNGGLHWYMRGQSSFSGSAPLVLVDDMRVTTGPVAEELANRPPYLDVIDIETVARVEILSGAATAARYGSGAGHGVIRIVTFAPRAQATAWRLYTAAGAIEDDVRYPATYGRPGSLPSGGTTSQCTLEAEADGRCTPTGPVTSFNPLETESPFERAVVARVGGAITSMIGPVAWRAGTTFDREGSRTSQRALQRLHVHGGASVRPSLSTEATVRAYWTRSDADVASPLGTSLLTQGLFPPEESAWPGFTPPPAADYLAERYGVAANARWTLAPWLQSHVAIGSERVGDRDESELTLVPPSPPRTLTRRGEYRGRQFTMRAEVAASYSGRAVAGATTVTVERAESRTEQEVLSIVRDDQGPLGFQSFFLNAKTEVTGVDLTQRIDLWRGVTVTAGVRLDGVDVGGTSWRTSPYPHAALSWDVRGFLPRAVDRLLLHAGLGDAGNLPRNVLSFFGPIIGVPEEPNVERTREREAGIDLEAARRRVHLSATWYTKRTSDVAALAQPVPMQPPGFIPLEVLNRGIEASLYGRILSTEGLAFDVGVRYAYNHNEVRRPEGAQFAFAFTPPHPQFVAFGAPLAAHRSADIVDMQDLDGNGVFDDACRVDVGGCEVLVSPIELRAAFPPTVASLESRLRIGGLTIAVLLDHRGGFYRANTTEAARCFTRCRGAYDDRAPLREQARATAVQWGFNEVFIEDATFTKLREISLRFAAPARWAEAFGASRLELSLAGRNVATWTDYSGLDPEAMSGSWMPLLSRDLAATPIPRRLSLRVTAARD